MLFGFFAGAIAATAIEAINKIGSLTYGPILGIFLLATVPSVTDNKTDFAFSSVNFSAPYPFPNQW